MSRAREPVLRLMKGAAARDPVEKLPVFRWIDDIDAAAESLCGLFLREFEKAAKLRDSIKELRTKEFLFA